MLPNNEAASTPIIADFIDPYSRYSGPLEDFEEGGIALNDASQGLDVQVWYLRYIDDESLATYGDFVVTAETTGETAVIINVPNVTRVGLAFNQNGDPFICYETRDCAGKYYYYDTVAADYVTADLPAGSKWLACCLDDHRSTQTGSSDTILGYIRGGSLYYRQERDRFLTERELTDQAGAGVLHRVGMTENLRLLFDVREGSGVRLSEIVGDLCAQAGVRGNQIDVTALYPIVVRGYKAAGQYRASDAIVSLMATYFFDFPKIDDKLVAVLRGGEIETVIRQADLVADRSFHFEDSREQGVEFPLKAHIDYAPAETDYIPTKQTSERRSGDIKSRSEFRLETAVNLTDVEANQRIHRIHEILWAEFEGRAEFALPEDFAENIPSTLISFEARPGQYKRMRLTRMVRVDNVFECEAVIDRGAPVDPALILNLDQDLPPPIGVPDPIPPEPPAPTLPGDTTWAFMDTPILDGVTDTLHYHTAGHGDAGTAWHGYRLQRLIGSDWETEADVAGAEIMGLVEESFPFSSPYFPDTTNTILLSLTAAPSSTTTDLMLTGRGAWLLIGAGGFEIIQVRDWVAEGDNWRGSYLFRGRLDTTPVVHPIATVAVFLGNPTRVPTDVTLVDTDLTLRAPSYGQSGSDAAEDDYPFIGRSQEEWPPEMLTGTQAVNDWVLAWVPRFRLGNSANPIPSSNFYAWRLRFWVGSEYHEHDTPDTDPSYTYTDAQQTADWGSPQASFDDVEVRALNYLGGEGKPLNEAIP